MLAIGRTESPLPSGDSDPQFPPDIQPLGLVLLAERLRSNAAETVGNKLQDLKRVIVIALNEGEKQPHGV